MSEAGRLIPDRATMQCGLIVRDAKSWEEGKIKIDRHGRVSSRLPAASQGAKVRTVTWVDSSVSVISPRYNMGKLSQRVNASLHGLQGTSRFGSWAPN